MEITSKPTALDEINRSVLKLEMEKLSLANDTDKASKDRLNRLEAELSLLKEKQTLLTEQWEHEKSVMTRIQSIKEEVHGIFLFLILFSIVLKIFPLNLRLLHKWEKCFGKICRYAVVKKSQLELEVARITRNGNISTSLLLISLFILTD